MAAVSRGVDVFLIVCFFFFAVIGLTIGEFGIGAQQVGVVGYYMCSLIALQTSLRLGMVNWTNSELKRYSGRHQSWLNITYGGVRMWILYWQSTRYGVLGSPTRLNLSKDSAHFRTQYYLLVIL